MLAFRLLRHSVLQLAGNLRAALILSVLPTAAVVVAGTLWYTVMRAMRGADGTTALAIAVHLAMAVVLLMAFVSLATSWHRFVLLEEAPRLLRPIGPSERRYLGASLRLALIGVLIAIPALFIGAALIAALSHDVWGRMIVNLIFGFAFTVLGLRLGTGLAGAATGAPRPLTTGWRATRGRLGTLVLLAVFGQLMQGALSLSALLPGLIGVVASIVVAWFETMLSLSQITTLWGHFVEGRALR